MLLIFDEIYHRVTHRMNKHEGNKVRMLVQICDLPNTQTLYLFPSATDLCNCIVTFCCKLGWDS